MKRFTVAKLFVAQMYVPWACCVCNVANIPQPVYPQALWWTTQICLICIFFFRSKQFPIFKFNRLFCSRATVFACCVFSLVFFRLLWFNSILWSKVLHLGYSYTKRRTYQNLGYEICSLCTSWGIILVRNATVFAFDYKWKLITENRFGLTLMQRGRHSHPLKTVSTFASIILHGRPVT